MHGQSAGRRRLVDEWSRWSRGATQRDRLCGQQPCRCGGQRWRGDVTEALEAANTNTAVTADVAAGSSAETDTITFDQAALQAQVGLGNPLVITLAGSELQITDNVDMVGLGVGVLTIDAAGKSRVVEITNAVTGAEISDLDDHGGRLYALRRRYLECRHDFVSERVGSWKYGQRVFSCQGGLRRRDRQWRHDVFDARHGQREYGRKRFEQLLRLRGRNQQRWQDDLDGCDGEREHGQCQLPVRRSLQAWDR